MQPVFNGVKLPEVLVRVDARGGGGWEWGARDGCSVSVHTQI